MSACTYRPPWPDEIERLHALLEGVVTASTWRRPRVWETAAPHRFAGAAIWSPPDPEKGEDTVEICFRFRPRFCDPYLAGELLRDLFREIRDTGHRHVRLTLGAREPWEKILANFGLKWTRLDECWVADALDGHERVQAMATQWSARQPDGWSVRKIEDSDEEFVMTKSGIAHFIDAVHLPGLWKNRAAELSCIIQSPSGPAGVLIATRRGMMAVLDFLGAAPEFRKQSSLISYLGLKHFSRRDHPDCFDKCRSIVDPAKGTASRSLMRRFGAHLTHTQHHFAGEIELVD